MKRIVILSGCSGSGKSHYAAELVAEEITEGRLARICSADYFFMSGDKYIFDPSRLGEAHSQCFRLFLSYMEKDSDVSLGNCALTEGQLWSEIQKACREWEKGDDTAGDWVSCVLSVLGIEWV